MISYEKSLEILRSKIDIFGIINHSIGVGDVAFEIAKAINLNNKVYVDPNLVRIAGLLHDIGKSIDGKQHELHTISILNSLNLHKISKHTMHGIKFEACSILGEFRPEFLPTTIEAYIVSLADMMFAHKKMLISERIRDINLRYENFPIVRLAMQMSRPRICFHYNLLSDLAGIDIETLLKLKK